MGRLRNAGTFRAVGVGRDRVAHVISHNLSDRRGARRRPPRSTGDTTAVPQCGQSDEGCTRIRGHIPAASERAGVETIGSRSASFGPPPAPFMSGLGAAGQAAADAVNRLFFLQVSHDDGAR